MSRAHGTIHDGQHGFPRVSGDEPTPGPTFDRRDTFSPRERG